MSFTSPSGAFESSFTGILFISDKFPDISSAVTFTVSLPSFIKSSPDGIVNWPDTSHGFPSFNEKLLSSFIRVFFPHVTV